MAIVIDRSLWVTKKKGISPAKLMKPRRMGPWKLLSCHTKTWILAGKSWENDGLMGLYGNYPLINVYIANWKITMFSGKTRYQRYQWPFSIAILT